MQTRHLYVSQSGGNDQSCARCGTFSCWSIQRALELAQNGDVVMVNTGTFDGNLDMGAKTLTLKSNPAASPAPIIDCGGKGTGVRFAQGQTHAAVLQGFTIRGCEHAVEIISSSPSIQDCTLQSNDAGVGNGSAISIVGTSSRPIISGCTINGNTANFGGGMYISSSAFASVLYSSFVSNVARFGGGVYVSSGGGFVFQASMATNNIAAAPTDGAGGFAFLETGSELHATSSSCTGNTATSNLGTCVRALGSARVDWIWSDVTSTDPNPALSLPAGFSPPFASYFQTGVSFALTTISPVPLTVFCGQNVLSTAKCSPGRPIFFFF